MKETTIFINENRLKYLQEICKYKHLQIISTSMTEDKLLKVDLQYDPVMIPIIFNDLFDAGFLNY